MTSVPHLIRSVMDEKQLTFRQVKSNAERAGHTLGLASLDRYAKGRATKYSREILQAIAAGLQIPEGHLLEAADMPLLGEPFQLPDEAALLEPHEREAVRSVVNAFIQNRQRRQEEVGGNRERSAPMTHAAGSAAEEHPDYYDLAADDSLHEGEHGQIGPDDVEHTT